MTRGQARNSSRLDAIRGIRAPRFRLKPMVHGSGYVDGAMPWSNSRINSSN
jgi:hypothetical protein